MQFEAYDEYAGSLNGKRRSSAIYAPPPKKLSRSSSNSTGSPVCTVKDKILTRYNDLLLDFPMPNHTARKLTIRGFATKYFNETEWIQEID